MAYVKFFTICAAAVALSVPITLWAIQVVNFLRDRAKIKIFTKRVTETFVHDGIPSAGDTATEIFVANAGRRPVTITGVRALFLSPDGSYLTLPCIPPVPKELTEGQQLMAVAEDERIDLAEVEAWEVIDALGNSYKKGVASFFPRVWSRLR